MKLSQSINQSVNQSNDLYCPRGKSLLCSSSNHSCNHQLVQKNKKTTDSKLQQDNRQSYTFRQEGKCVLPSCVRTLSVTLEFIYHRTIFCVLPSLVFISSLNHTPFKLGREPNLRTWRWAAVCTNALADLFPSFILKVCFCTWTPRCRPLVLVSLWSSILSSSFCSAHMRECKCLHHTAPFKFKMLWMC